MPLREVQLGVQNGENYYSINYVITSINMHSEAHIFSKIHKVDKLNFSLRKSFLWLGDIADNSQSRVDLKVIILPFFYETFYTFA